MKRTLPILTLCIVTVLFRLPFLLNPWSLSSDHAVVGLQAQTLFKGEWTWFLWGVGYQGILEPLLTRGFSFWISDPAWQLIAVGMLGFQICVTLTYLLLIRYLPPLRAFVITCFAIATSIFVSRITVFPPRIWAVTAVFLSIFLLDSSRLPSRWKRVYLALGIVSMFFSLYVDFYTIQFLPAVLLYAYFRWREDPKLKNSLCVGLVLGALFLLMTRSMRPQGGVPLSFSPAIFKQNIPLLLHQALPALFGFSGPMEKSVVAFAAWLFLGLLILSPFLRRSQKGLRDLSVFGGVVTATSLVGFSGSSMASDIHSCRYLAVLLWAAPLTLATLAGHLKGRFFYLIFLPLLIALGLAGWDSHTPFVVDRVAVATPEGNALEERQVVSFLRNENIRYAEAQYWISYRMSLLSENNPIVVPDNEYENRYRPFWENYQKENRRAAVYLDSEARSLPENKIAELQKRAIPFTRKQLGHFSVLIWNELLPSAVTQGPTYPYTN